MRVVFMGTPAYVSPVLQALVSARGVETIAVYTPPDRPRGRGRSPQLPPVKEQALALQLPVYQPASLRSSRVQEELAGLHPDVIVVAAYGRLLPTPVLNTAPHGCLNLHPSLLPRYRGPSPIVSAILDGETRTGVTLMLLDEGMDTGPIIAQKEFAIPPEANSETLTGQLFLEGAGLLMENLAPWVEGDLTAAPQDDAGASVTSLVEREDGRADWRLAAELLERRCRAYTPWPGLFTDWEGRVLKLLEVQPLESDVAPGKAGIGRVVALEDEAMPVGVATGEGILGLRSLQLEGRRAVSAVEFLRGYSHFIGAQL